jgi:ribosomal protein S19
LLIQVEKDQWKVWSCGSCIFLQFVGCYAQIITKKGYVALNITKKMVGHKFGKFVSTQKFYFFGKKALPLKTKVKLKENV